jgi:hypothetical protein
VKLLSGHLKPWVYAHAAAPMSNLRRPRPPSCLPSPHEPLDNARCVSPRRNSGKRELLENITLATISSRLAANPTLAKDHSPRRRTYQRYWSSSHVDARMIYGAREATGSHFSLEVVLMAYTFLQI